jgi:uncharacterized protein YkwD
MGSIALTTVALLASIPPRGGHAVAPYTPAFRVAPPPTTSCPRLAIGWTGILGIQLLGTRTPVEADVVRRINQVRIRHKLTPLLLSAPLRSAARYHSSDMQAKHYFAHQRVGETFAQRFALYTPSRCIAENIAWGTGSFGQASGIVSLWMASPEHRHIILLPWLRQIGVGVAVGRFFGAAAASITTADFSA